MNNPRRPDPLVWELVNAFEGDMETLAYRAGVSLPTIYRWRSGALTPSLRHLRALAEIVGRKLEAR